MCEHPAMVVAWVAGASGYTGGELVRALVERGATAIAHVRPDSSRLSELQSRFASLGAQTDATPWTLEAMSQVMRERAPTHLFAVLGTTRARAKSAEQRGAERSDYEAVDYGLTKMLLDAALKAGIKPRFIYLSSAGVTASTSSAYLEVRWRMEQDIARSGLSYAIVRPSFITGPDRAEDRPMERIAARVADSALAFAGLFGGRQLRDRYRSTDASTLARVMVRIGLEDTPSKIYESEELR